MFESGSHTCGSGIASLRLSLTHSAGGEGGLGGGGFGEGGLGGGGGRGGGGGLGGEGLGGGGGAGGGRLRGSTCSQTEGPVGNVHHPSWACFSTPAVVRRLKNGCACAASGHSPL